MYVTFLQFYLETGYHEEINKKGCKKKNIYIYRQARKHELRRNDDSTNVEWSKISQIILRLLKLSSRGKKKNSKIRYMNL